jgi:hypothetical protein
VRETLEGWSREGVGWELVRVDYAAAVEVVAAEIGEGGVRGGAEDVVEVWGGENFCSPPTVLAAEFFPRQQKFRERTGTKRQVEMVHGLREYGHTFNQPRLVGENVIGRRGGGRLL